MRESSRKNILSNTRRRASTNNTNTLDQGSFHFLRNANVDSSYNQIISIRSRTVVRIKATVPEQNYSHSTFQMIAQYDITVHVLRPAAVRCTGGRSEMVDDRLRTPYSVQ